MLYSNKRYKQVLIDIDNYTALKKLGQTGDSFNSVIGKLIEQFKAEVTK
jgi:predicted CopG family antitoxin